jgi:hypothetical protein
MCEFVCTYTTCVHIWFYIYNDKRRTSGQERVEWGHLGRAEHFENVVGEKCRHCRTVLVNALQDLHQHLIEGRLIDRLKQAKIVLTCP